MFKLDKGMSMMLKSLGLNPEEISAMGNRAISLLQNIDDRLNDLQRRLKTIEAAIYEEEQEPDGINSGKPN